MAAGSGYINLKILLVERDLAECVLFRDYFKACSVGLLDCGELEELKWSVTLLWNVLSSQMVG